MLYDVYGPVTAPNISRAAKFPEDQDAHLRYLCAKAQAISIYSDAIWGAVGMMQLGDPRWEATSAESNFMMETYYALVHQIELLPAHTREGEEGKAGIILFHLRSDLNSSAIALSLARDVLARSAAA